MTPTVRLEYDLTPADLLALKDRAADDCECTETVRLIVIEAPKLLCESCKIRRWINDGGKYVEGLS